MFLESNNKALKRGRIEVICGSIFSGKTEELIRRLRRSELARQKIEIYKPDIDQRYDSINIVSHQWNQISSTLVQSSFAVLLLAGDVEVVSMKPGFLLCRSCFNQNFNTQHV